ncbi:site-specific integrase [Liquorilactobacillus vini]|uniref:Integrase family protein n=2 Tax=Liquorilactobacillus vini TaxID=238015 RepID=A0A0R2BRB7_9LACO|nr:integrase family protein [Liquorilactobacillus vini DSM 20605]
MILTAIYTGMRLDEIQALTWKDINPIWKTISINKAWDYTRGGDFKNTKNESSKRIIRINQQLIDWLMELKSNGSEMVFMSQFKTVPTSNSVNQMLKELLNELGLQKKNFHFHSLRHSHVAYLLSQGISIYAISKRLGHSNISTTINTYAYLLDEFKARQDDLFEKNLNKLQHPGPKIATPLQQNNLN